MPGMSVLFAGTKDAAPNAMTSHIERKIMSSCSFHMSLRQTIKIAWTVTSPHRLLRLSGNTSALELASATQRGAQSSIKCKPHGQHTDYLWRFWPFRFWCCFDPIKATTNSRMKMHQPPTSPLLATSYFVKKNPPDPSWCNFGPIFPIDPKKHNLLMFVCTSLDDSGCCANIILI